MASLYLGWLLACFFSIASILAYPDDKPSAVELFQRDSCRGQNCTARNHTSNGTADAEGDLHKPRVDDSYQKLLERLRWYLGKAGSANLTDTRREIEFSDVSGLDAVRQINMNADIPQKLLDAVQPEAAERLMELMVRIAENPSEWQPIHKALGTLDNRDSTSHRRRKRSNFEHHHRKGKKHKKTRRHHVVDSVRSAAHKTRRKFKKKLKTKHRSKHYYGRYRLNVTEPFQTKFRHHSIPRYGFYSPDSLASLLEAPFQQKDTNENKHFERWKVKSGWAVLRNGSQNFHSKIHELRRWGLLKQHEDWRKSNVIGENAREKASKVNSEARLEEKATLLATNNWPSATIDRPPRFSFHRVTASSPNLLSRSQKRQRSAYVAVSLIPNNITGPSETKPRKVTSSESTVSSSSWPDLFDQLFLVNNNQIASNFTGSDGR